MINLFDGDLGGIIIPPTVEFFVRDDAYDEYYDFDW